MDRTAKSIFMKLHEVSSKAFKLLLSTAISPEKEKVLKEWGITEAAEMVGRTSQTLRNLEETKKIPKARQIVNGKRKERTYSLSEINKLRDYFGTRPRKPDNASAAILGFTNFKGGSGKTTSAICTAQYFALKGYRVLFLDCDSQASATQMFGFIPDEDFNEKETLLNILIDESKDIKTIIKKTYWDGLDLIPANLSLYNAELLIPFQNVDYNLKTGKQLPFYNRLHNAIQSIADDYDIIVFDCPPSMGMISVNAIYAANALIIPVPPSIVDYASTIQFFKMVGEVMERLPNKAYSFVRVLITKYVSRVSASQLQEFLRASLGQYVMATNMIVSEAISKASSNVQTLYEIDKFDGHKKTYQRAIQQADRVNEELEASIRMMWEKNLRITNVNNIPIGELAS